MKARYTYRYRKTKRRKSYHIILFVLALIILLGPAIYYKKDIESFVVPAAGMKPPAKADIPDGEDALPGPAVSVPASNLQPTQSAAQPVHAGPDYQFPPIQNGMVAVVSKIPTKSHVVFLTIDDGIVTSPDDARLMNSGGVKATFFLVYRFIKREPDFFAGLAQASGSDIENHSYDHYQLTNMNYDAQKLDICQNADVFDRLFGSRPVLFRPSGGAYNDDTLRAAAACGSKALIMWDASINNGVLRTQSGYSLRPGDIVLMHFRNTFAEDLAAFVRAAKAAGLQPDLLVNWL